MNRLICPSCKRPSFTASLQGPLHCAHEDCGELLLPGDEVDVPGERRSLPRVRPDVAATVEYLARDERRVERDKRLVDVTIAGLSAVLDELPTLGSRVVVELEGAGPDHATVRVRGIVREVTPAEEAGYRVGIELAFDDSPGAI